MTLAETVSYHLHPSTDMLIIRPMQNLHATHTKHKSNSSELDEVMMMMMISMMMTEMEKA